LMLVLEIIQKPKKKVLEELIRVTTVMPLSFHISEPKVIRSIMNLE